MACSVETSDSGIVCTINCVNLCTRTRRFIKKVVVVLLLLLFLGIFFEMNS